MSYIKRLYKDKYIKNIQPYIVENIQYETIMGSISYGVSSETSDMDLYSFTIPPKGIVFPHLDGYIHGFGKQPPSFNVTQIHHIDAYEKSFDINVYNIVTYFQLLMDNNPNMVDSLFTRDQFVTSSTKIGDMIRDNRKIFLHKGSWHRFKGYAYSQLKKIRSKEAAGKRKKVVDKYGYDVKFAYHVIRLLNEVEQIMMHGDIDLMQNKDQLKSIRRGEWELEYLEEFARKKEQELETLYLESTIPKYPDEQKIKQLLLNCLEEFYGSLTSEDVMIGDKMTQAIQEIKAITNRF